MSDIYKPYDIVSDKDNNIGFIREVSNPQENFYQYSVEWLYGNNTRTAWYTNNQLIVHCNLFVKIAECSCHPFGNNARKAKGFLFDEKPNT